MVVVDLVAALVVAADAVLLWVVVRPRFRRAMEAGDREWRDNFRALDPARRKAIVHSMRHGEPVRNPGDVELLLRGDAQLDYVFRAIRPFKVLTLPIMAALLAIAVENHIHFMFFYLGAVLLLSLVTGLWAWWQKRRRKQAVAATRHLHGA